MSLVTLQDASYAYGADRLLEHADFAIEDGEKICLVGRNGTGKSTLMKIIEGQVELDGGQMIVQKDLQISRLDQDPPRNATGTVYSLTASGVPLVGAALAEFATASVARQAELAALIEKYGGWDQDAEVRKILNAMELDPDAPLQGLSGGLRRKAALAAALAAKPKLLLLDEPTNHLDLDNILWLEQWINHFRGTLLFVTHDRALADNCASRIVELDRGQLYSYPGSFSRYLQLREERLRKEELANREFDRVLSEEEAWIRRGVKARLARNEGRVRDLEERRRLRRERRDRPGMVNMTVSEAGRSGNMVFEIHGLCLKGGERTLVRDFSADVIRGDRIGITGPNGAGKTTLLRALLGEIRPDGGRIRRGVNLEVQYFDQYHERLDFTRTAEYNVADGRGEVFINGRSLHVLSYLGNFLFTGARARTPVSELSGGEQNRLMLARIFAKPSNLLILDEPTNDLDLETLELLEEQLSSYRGTVLVISHDRRFIDRVVSETWVFDGKGGIEDIIGGWNDVLACYERRAQEEAAAAVTPKKMPGHVKAPRSTRRSGLTFTEAFELKGLPEKLEALEQQLSETDAAFADPELYKNGPGRAAELKAKRNDLQAQLDHLYARWEELEKRASEDSSSA